MECSAQMSEALNDVPPFYYFNFFRGKTVSLFQEEFQEVFIIIGETGTILLLYFYFIFFVIVAQKPRRCWLNLKLFILFLFNYNYTLYFYNQSLCKYLHKFKYVGCGVKYSSFILGMWKVIIKLLRLNFSDICMHMMEDLTEWPWAKTTAAFCPAFAKIDWQADTFLKVFFVSSGHWLPKASL